MGRFVRMQTGSSGREGQRRAKIAEQLASLPRVADQLANGEITLEHAQVLTDVHSDRRLRDAVEADQNVLLAEARELDPDRFRRSVDRWRNRHTDDDGAGDQERKYKRRSVKTWTTDDGMWALHALLDPVSGAQVQAALSRLADKRWREADHNPGSPINATRNQYMADALIDMASGSTASGGGESGSRGGEHLLPIIMIDHDRLNGGQGRCQLIDGTPVPATTAERALCDNAHRVAVTDSTGDILHLGRRTRLASAAQRAALQLRDGGCVWPGCHTSPDWCQAHHLEPWQQGGRTDLDNLALVCTKHHHLIHEGHWTISRDDTGTWHTRRPE